MTDQLISFETAKLAKEKGFVNGSQQDYRNSELTPVIRNLYHANNVMQGFVYEAPTQSLLQKWLREVHNIHILLAATGITDGSGKSISNTYDVMFFKDICKTSFDSSHNSYEEALEFGLQEALKLI